MNSPLTITSAILASLMVASAGFASYLKPTNYLADTRPAGKIEGSLPTEFGKWRLIPTSSGVVNPQQATLINVLYSETITRTYVSESGGRVMLSIAYGRNQNDTFLLHTPDICYPAQGFSISSSRVGELSTPFGIIPVKQLTTNLGAARPEPVTYWTTLGDYTVRSGTDKKLKEVSYAMKGLIADGLLFRVSSIDPDPERAFSVHKEFVNEFLGALSVGQRSRLAGLSQ